MVGLSWRSSTNRGAQGADRSLLPRGEPTEVSGSLRQRSSRDGGHLQAQASYWRIRVQIRAGLEGHRLASEAISEDGRPQPENLDALDELMAELKAESATVQRAGVNHQ